MREPETWRWCAPRSRGAYRPVRAQRARGSASRSRARTTNEVRGIRSRRGFPRRKGGVNLHSSRSGPREARLSGVARSREARQPRAPRKTDVSQGEGSRRAASPSSAERGSHAARSRCPYVVVSAEVCRPPSGSEKRATRAGPVESRSAAKERANGSLTRSVSQSRKRATTPPAKGRWFFEERPSSSRECRCSRKVTRVRSSFWLVRAASDGCRGKAFRIGKAHAFSRGPRGTDLGGLWIDARCSLKCGAQPARKRRRQECQRRTDTVPCGGRKRLPTSTARSPK